jgi:hypothetical protein
LKSRTVLTVVGDNDTRASNNLPGFAFSVDFLYFTLVKARDPIEATDSKTGPLSENFGVGDFDELDVVLGT